MYTEAVLMRHHGSFPPMPADASITRRQLHQGSAALQHAGARAAGGTTKSTKINQKHVCAPSALTAPARHLRHTHDNSPGRAPAAHSSSKYRQSSHGSNAAAARTCEKIFLKNAPSGSASSSSPFSSSSFTSAAAGQDSQPTEQAVSKYVGQPSSSFLFSFSSFTAAAAAQDSQTVKYNCSVSKLC